MRLVWTSACVVSLLLLASCGGGSLTTLAPLSAQDDAELQGLLLDLKVRYRLIETLRTYMRVQIETADSTQEVREELRYQHPDKLKVVALGAFSEPKAVILAVEDQFTLYLIQENEAIRDTLSDQVLTEIFGVDLRISDVRSALFANPFLQGETQNLHGERSGSTFRIQRISTRVGYLEEIELSLQTGEPLVTSWKLLDAQHRLVQRSSFEDYREVGGLMMPFKTVISRPLQDTRVIFQIDRPELNPPFGSKTFELALPENTRIRKASSL